MQVSKSSRLFLTAVFICAGTVSRGLRDYANAQPPASSPAASAAAREGQPADGGTANGGTWGVRRAVNPDPALPWVLLIGDSVTNGYGGRVVKQLNGKANVDLWITPAWLGPELFQSAPAIVGARPYRVIHFNESGLHAWAEGRIPQGQYGPLMRSYLQLLHKAAPQAQLIWATTTPMTVAGAPEKLDDLDKLIAGRNQLCKPIMQQDGIPVDDLYGLLLPHLDLGAGDRAHWTDKGYALMADAAARSISSELQKPH
jgi:lysophospholipase L1-like esterase